MPVSPSIDALARALARSLGRGRSRTLASRTTGLGLGFGLAVTLGLLACAPQAVGRYDRDQLAATLTAPEPAAGLMIGEFVLQSPAVVDGDTLKVVGIEGTLRLLAIDTEETFKSDKDLRAYSEGFDTYLANEQAGHTRPIKAATPLGMDAKHWAEDFLEGVRTVRLERDHPKELRGRYGRLLTYVMVEKDGRWLNYNVECVRAGMSPYFTKYGYSRRFHDEFVQAQDEARAAERGIWDPAREHYRDYDVRLQWWDARADVIARFEEEAAGREDWIALTNWDAMERLEALEGREVVVLATIGDIRPREGKRPGRVMLSRRMFSDLPLIFFDDDVLERSAAEEAKGEYVRVQGTVSRYEFAARRSRVRKDQAPRSQLQIQIRRPEQIAFVDTRPASVAAGGVPPRTAGDGEPEADAETEADVPETTQTPDVPAAPETPDVPAPTDATDVPAPTDATAVPDATDRPDEAASPDAVPEPPPAPPSAP